jgi:hypothetical protein
MKWIRNSYPSEMEEEIKRIILDCSKLGVRLRNKKEAWLLAAQKSKKGQMTKEEITNYLNSIEKKL